MPKLSNNTKILLIATALIWLLEIIDQLLLQGLFGTHLLDNLGIKPRSLLGLIGIPLMPLLHASFAHLTSNTLPLLTLGYITTKIEPKKFITTTNSLILLSGLGTWLIAGKNEIHIGASALIYAYFGYIITSSIIRKKPSHIIISIIIFLIYGSMLYGIIPAKDQPISWEGHLCGLLSGIFLAKTSKPKTTPPARTTDI